MYKFLSLVTLFLLCRVKANDLEVFQKLSELNDKWLLASSISEAAVLLQRPPYSYHASDLNLGINISNIISEVNEYQGIMTSDAKIKSCSDDLAQIVFNVESGWAVQMLDSDGKLSSGVLRGGVIWPGHFGECTSAYAPKDAKGHGDFHGQYCITTWTLNLGGKYSNLPLQIGLCVPDSCTAAELKNTGVNVLHLLDRVPVLKKYSHMITLTSVKCKLKEKTLDLASIIYLVFVFCFILLTVSGSVVSVLEKRKKRLNASTEFEEQTTIQVSSASYGSISADSEAPAPSLTRRTTSISHILTDSEACDDKASFAQNAEIEVPASGFQQKKTVDPVWKRILMCFSVFENGERILNTDTAEGQLLSIHGIRFLSLTWVIIGHTYISSVAMVGNKLDVLEEMDKFIFQVLLQSPFSVDSFFLLSGFLLAYLFLKEAAKKNGKISWLYFYVHRFWRLTPAYMVVVFFYMLVFKYLGSGPFWEDDHCDASRGSWWKYLLYINNFIPIKQMCIGWSWYLANDMQFYIISPLFLYPLWRWPKVGFGILISMLVGTWTLTAVLSYQYDIIPMFVGVAQAPDFSAYETRMWNSFDLIYDKPYSRIAPYLIGVILGFMLNKLNQRKNFMNWWQQLLGWLIAAFCSLSVMFGLYHVEMSKTTAMFYNSLCRSAFSIGLAWIILICETGHGGFITRLLSWRFFIPLSRLTYCAYLVHPILIHAYYMALQTEFFFTELTMVTNFMGFLIMAYGLAFMFSLTFESPLMNLEKLVLKNKSK